VIVYSGNCLINLIIVILTIYPAVADVINFENGNSHGENYQQWLGQVIDIQDSFVTIKFKHDRESLIVKIHISRIYAIYFDERYEHISSLNLNQNRLKQPITSNLNILRKLYVTEPFKEEYDTLKVIGQGNATQLSGNIIELSTDKEVASIFARKKNGSNEIIANVPVYYIRAWVR